MSNCLLLSFRNIIIFIIKHVQVEVYRWLRWHHHKYGNNSWVAIHLDRETPDACRPKCNLYFSSNLSNRPKQYSKKKKNSFPQLMCVKKNLNKILRVVVSFASISIKGECRDRRFQLFILFFSSFSWRDNLWTLVKKQNKQK
jgi:hypothetical protein